MYLVKTFHPDLGDLDDVLSAESLDDGVGAALERLGKSVHHRVSMDEFNGYPRVQVWCGDIVVASIEDAPMAAPADGAVVDAVNDMAEGRLELLKALFVAEGQEQLAGEPA